MTPQSPAPVAGRPLTAEDVEIIRDYWSAYADADWHLIPEAIRDDFDARLVAVGLAEWRAVTADDLDDAFAHDRGLEAGGSCLDLTALGYLAFKADADGWIFNTEGWAENPVPGTTVEYRCRSGSTWALPVSVPSEALRWGNSGWSGDIIAFRLSRPASEQPVEAIDAGREEALHPHAQPFERYPELASHIERMAMSGVIGSLISWEAFLRELNAALSPASPARSPMGDPLRRAVEGIDADYMTSETHHPGYVLIPTAKFEEIRQALAALQDGGA